MNRKTRYERKGVLRRSIDNHCKQCIYDPISGGTWREQVTLCTVSFCPLYPVRPLSENAVVLLDGNFGHHKGSYKSNLRRRVVEEGRNEQST